MTIRRCAFALALIVACLIGYAPRLRAESPPVQLWHIPFTDQASLQQLARDFDVWEVNHADRRILAALTPAEAAQIAQTYSITLVSDQSPLTPAFAAASQINGIPGYACYRTVDETFATLDQLATDYPHFVEPIDIGDSWDKTHAGGTPGGTPGDDLRVLIITNKKTTGPKFRFMLMGALHAREYTTAELALRFAESLLQGYGSDANATWLLDHGELHLLTVANPDGRRIAETGQLWRKNTNTDAACSLVSLPGSSYGVDLNRNSSFHWNKCQGFNCSSADSCRETYRGDAPASEPEVAAIQSYLRKIFPDQREDDLQASAPLTKDGIFISLHSYGRLILFPWGWTTTHAPNAYGLATLARRLGYPLGYTVCQAGGAGCLYQTDGTTDDFAYGDLGLAAFTIELGTNFFQSCTYFESSILQQGLATLRYAFKAAPQPFILAEGPEVVNVMVSPTHMDASSTLTTSVAVSATVDASRIAFLSGSNVASITEPLDRIRGARLTINSLPWASNPITYPLSAADGSFNTVQETATANVEMACLPEGRHTLFVQAQDDAGDWGVVAAQFVTVTNSSPFSVTVAEPYAETIDGNAVTYTVALTNTGVTTSTYNVEVTSHAEYALQPSQPLTLTAGVSLMFNVVITPQNKTASTLVPTVIKVRSGSDAAQCRQVGLQTQVKVWPYRQWLLIIAKN